MIENAKLVYTTHIPVRWGDLDALNHVNSSVYFTYFEQARIMWWQDKLKVELKNITQGPVVVTSECTFLKQIFYPADLIVKVYAGSPGTSSFMIYYEIELKSEPNVVYAKGSTKIVWVDYKAGKSLPLPETIKSQLLL